MDAYWNLGFSHMEGDGGRDLRAAVIFLLLQQFCGPCAHQSFVYFWFFWGAALVYLWYLVCSNKVVVLLENYQWATAPH